MHSFWSLRGRPTRKSEYKGIPECALPGQHAAIFEHFREAIPPNSRVIDLASGRGAWPKRLMDAGYETVATELNMEICNVPCTYVDLNDPFSDKFDGAFDAVSSIELLEHIENPRHIIREANRLLKEGGKLFLSTPNASGVHSRVKFLFTGKFAQFDEEQYQSIGHITPLTFWQLEKMLIEAGFEVQFVKFHNHHTLVPHTVGEVVKLMSSVFLRPFMRGVAGGQTIIISATKIGSI